MLWQRRKHERVLRQLLTLEHETIQKIREQVEQDVVFFELRTHRSQWGLGRDCVALTPVWETKRPHVLLGAPTLMFPVGTLVKAGRQIIQLSIDLISGQFSGLHFRTMDGGSYPGRIGDLQPDLSMIPEFTKPDYSDLRKPFHTWLKQNVPVPFNGDPSFRDDSGIYPASYEQFYQAYSHVTLGDVYFNLERGSPEPLVIDSQEFYAVATDDSGNLYAVHKSQDQVYFLSHDPFQTRDLGLSFEEFVRELVEGRRNSS